MERLAQIAEGEVDPLWERILENLPFAAVWTFGGQIAGLNAESVRMFGLSRRTLPLSELWATFEMADGSGHHLTEGERPLARALRGETVPRTRYQMLRPDGNRLHVAAFAYPVSTPFGAGAVAIYEDLAFSLEEQGRFEEWLAALGHELAGALHTVTVAVRLSLRKLEDDPDAARHHLELSLRSSEVLGRLVHDFIDAARLGAGTLEWCATEIFLEAFLGRVMETAGIADAKHHFSLAVERDLAVRADPHRLEQILTNLFSNARKYSNPGAIAVTAAHEGTSVAIAVTDTGPGIAPEQAANLFRRYHRLPSREQGAGIGLWLCRELAMRMGGDLSLVSRVGGPTTFKLLLPQA